MGWIKWVGKGLEFVGQFAQAPGVEEWVEQQADALIAEFITKRGLRDTTSKQEIAASLLDELQVAAKSPALGIAIQKQVSRYLPILGKLAREHALGTLYAGRTYVVPRFAWNKYLDNVTLEKANLSIAYMENTLVDPGRSRRWLFRPRGNTGGPRLSKALDGYVAANLCL